MTAIDHSLVGIASSANDSFTSAPLIMGDTPPVVTTPEVVGSSALATANTVVGFNSSGLIVAADPDTAPAIGITQYAAVAGGPVGVYRAGCFNPDLLNWPAAYSTALLKKTAFLATGTQIFTRQPPAL